MQVLVIRSVAFIRNKRTDTDRIDRNRT